MATLTSNVKPVLGGAVAQLRDGAEGGCAVAARETMAWGGGLIALAGVDDTSAAVQNIVEALMRSSTRGVTFVELFLESMGHQAPAHGSR
jgi:hypothetical protein